jgi:glutamine synthetase
MTKVVAEYVWCDALGATRSKTKVFDKSDKNITLLDFSEWNFDGSSTGQAEGKKSDVVLKPARLFKDPFRRSWKDCECFLVWCDTYNMDGTPHPTNNRHECMSVCDRTKDEEPWFGMEQEYILYQLGNKLSEPQIPYGWMDKDLPNYRYPEQAHPKVTSSVICNDGYYPLPSGPFYCANGSDRALGRPIVEQHLEYCIYAGVKVCGLNAEVSPSQWEFQVGVCSGDEMGDHLWMARYILSRVAEEHKAFVELAPKPMLLFNGSGNHTNFSTKAMREDGGLTVIEEACKKMQPDDINTLHLKAYGDENNKDRLTGKHETATHDKCTYGFSDRGKSIRVPYLTHKAGKGYLEDRRPSSDCDPYKVVTRMLKTICLDDK